MKNTFRIIALMTVLQANAAFAASGVEVSELGLAGWIFLGFLALIVALQFVPALIMIGSMLAGVFGKAKDHEGVKNN